MSPAEEKEKKGIEEEPYRFEMCTITVMLTFLPDDGDPQGRQVIVGCRSHLDAPDVCVYREQEIQGNLEEIVNEVLEEIRGKLPQRHVEKLRRESQKGKKTRGKRAAAQPTKPGEKKADEPTQMALFQDGGKR